MTIKAEWIELVETILFDDSIKGDKAKKNITALSAELLIAVVPLIAQEAQEKVIALFKDNIPCMPDLFGHGCNQEHKDCARCKYITDVVEAVRQSLVSREAHND